MRIVLIRWLVCTGHPPSDRDKKNTNLSVFLIIRVVDRKAQGI